jgi:hypothetical protein
MDRWILIKINVRAKYVYNPESGADLHFDNVDNDVGLGWFDGILAADLVKEIWQWALKVEKYVSQGPAVAGLYDRKNASFSIEPTEYTE